MTTAIRSLPAEAAAKILTEDCLTLEQAREEIFQATGRRPDKSSVYRWCLKGCRGTRLEHIRLGDRILTSRQALTRFVTARSV